MPAARARSRTASTSAVATYAEVVPGCWVNGPSGLCDPSITPPPSGQSVAGRVWSVMTSPCRAVLGPGLDIWELRDQPLRGRQPGELAEVAHQVGLVVVAAAGGQAGQVERVSRPGTLAEPVPGEVEA